MAAGCLRFDFVAVAISCEVFRFFIRAMGEYLQEANGIFSMPLLGPQICLQLIKRLNQSTKWETATVGSQAESGEVESVEDVEFRAASVLFSGDAPDECDQIAACMKESIGPVVRDIWSLDLCEFEPVQFVRYSPGGHYKSHADAALDLDDRYFTALCYLNDDFEGGCTTFPYLNNFSLSPRTGMAVIFPSRYVHRAEPVLKGHKYIAVTWLHGPVAVKWI